MAYSIPKNTNTALVEWLETFAAAITADPAAYGTTAVVALDLTNAVVAFRAAYDNAGVVARLPVNHATYTQPNRATMYAARDNALAIAEPLAGLIQANTGIADATKLAAGVQPPTTERFPIAAPSTQPIVSLVASIPGAANLAIADSTTPALKARPYGTAGAELAVAVGTAPVVDPALATFRSLATRTPFQLSLAPTDAGKVLSVFARWRDSRGRVGPWSAPVTVYGT